MFLSPKLAIPAVILLLTFLVAAHGAAQEMIEVPELVPAFEAAQVSGTFVVLDPEKGKLFTHNLARARTRFIPASTFKIANTLIGLDCGAIQSVDDVLPYGGAPQPVKAWERDMSLREAIKISNVPVYQALARRIGIVRMREGIGRLQYGNREVGEVVDRFWLDGPLEITAEEQVDFLRRLTSGKLEVAPEAVAAVQEITLMEGSDGAALHGKTGWATSGTPKIGWFVGWVEKGGKHYPFALNIDMPDEAQAPKRVPLAKECLRILGVL